MPDRTLADPGETSTPNRSSPLPAWLAFGQGTRRCMGAEFAINEIDIVLKTVLQNFQIRTDSTADEKANFRGVTYAPKRGGRVTLTRRR
jgi:cytochrome P450